MFEYRNYRQGEVGLILVDDIESARLLEVLAMPRITYYIKTGPRKSRIRLLRK